MEEIWKRVTYKEYNHYLVSNLGRVKNDITGKILKPYEQGTGYLSVTLYNRGKKKTFFIHRLVAQAFISNHDNLPEVNHIDEDRKNNRVSNLEWCTRKYNCNYGNHNKNISKSLLNTDKGVKTPITLVNKETGNKVSYNSLRECSRSTGVGRGCIKTVLQGGFTRNKILNNYFIYYKGKVFKEFDGNAIDFKEGVARIEYIKNTFPNLKLLSNKSSINSQEKIKVLCLKHNKKFITTYSMIKHQKYACRDCYMESRSINAYLSKDDMQRLLNDKFNNNISIIKGYIDKRTLCTLHCKACEQNFKGIPYNVLKNKDNGCPNCLKSKHANSRKRDNKGRFISPKMDSRK